MLFLGSFKTKKALFHLFSIPSMTTTFTIQGGKKLSGSIPVRSSKNATMSILCAAVLVQNSVRLEDVPDIQEVKRMLELLQSIGVSCVWKGPGILEIDSRQPLKLSEMNQEACTKTRSSLLLLGALAARATSYKLYKTGGCKLGQRTVRPHLYALEKFGVSVVSKDLYYEVKNKPLKAQDIVMYESGDTPTENAIMAAILAPGTTTIDFASSNYMVQDLCYFLVAAGAKIEGIGTTTLTITGVKKLHGVTYAIMPDPIIAMTWIALGITTKSPITITNCPLAFISLELEKLRIMGQQWSVHKKRQSKNTHFTIVDITLIPSDLKALPDKLYGRPFPGLNIDNVPFFVSIATQAKGRTLIHDWVYENRAIYYLELQKLGANMLLLDPHRVMVEGKTTLKANELICPEAIRPAMMVLLCMIAAKGTSTLRHCYPIERGYEQLVTDLQHIGVRIEKTTD